MPALARLLFPPDFPGGLPGQVIQVQNDGTLAWTTLSVSGAPLPFTPVDSLTATPRSVVDWGPIINTALTNGTRAFWFGPFDYPFSTGINDSDYVNTTFHGSNGVMGTDSTRTDFNGNVTGCTRLLWSGTGSGPAIDCSSTNITPDNNRGTVFRDLALLWTGSAWTGTLINFFQSSFMSLENVYLGAVNENTQNTTAWAGAEIDIGGTNGFLARKTTFGSAFQTSVKLSTQGVPAGCWTEQCGFEDCLFQGGGGAIFNPGGDIEFRNCNFEFPNLRASPASTGGTFISWDGSTRTTFFPELTFIDCVFWDAGPNGQTWLSQPEITASNSPLNLVMISCHENNSEGNLTNLLTLQGGGSVFMYGNRIANICDFGNGGTQISPAVPRKKNLVLVGNSTPPDNAHTYFKNVDSHENVVSLGNSSHEAAYPGDGLIGFQHERCIVSSNNKPTIAAHAGSSNIGTPGLVSGSTDLAGIINIPTTSGGASNTGLIADITFANAITSLNNSSVAVQLTVVGNAGGSPSATIAAQPYYQVLGASTNTGFSIGVNVAIPLSTTIALSYRVTLL